MTKKSTDTLKVELSNSLAIIEREIIRLPEFRLGWQSLATQLYKVLCLKRQTPLIKLVVPDPSFHPLKTVVPNNKYLMYHPWRMQFTASGGLVIDCFDENKPRIPLSDWLQQIILVSDHQDLTITDVITLPRNKEAAHSDPKEGGKIRALKNAFLLRIGGQEYSSHQVSLAVIGAYIVDTVPKML